MLVFDSSLVRLGRTGGRRSAARALLISVPLACDFGDRCKTSRPFTGFLAKKSQRTLNPAMIIWCVVRSDRIKEPKFRLKTLGQWHWASDSVTTLKGVMDG